MRNSLTFILLLAFVFGKGQTKLLSKYQFEKGGYAIVGLLSESDPNELQKQLGEFYTNDIKVLNDFKKIWSFNRKSPMYACGYHYSIQLTHNGIILESFEINLNCNVIASDKGYFYFDTIKLSQFKKRLKKPIKKTHSFASIAEGRAFITEIKKDTNLLLTFEPTWTKFEGTFAFAYKNPDKNDDQDVVEKRLIAQIQKTYPNEKFKLSQVMWGSDGSYKFEIICNKTLFDEFTLYQKKNDWEQYKAKLTTYWK